MSHMYTHVCGCMCQYVWVCTHVKNMDIEMKRGETNYRVMGAKVGLLYLMERTTAITRHPVVPTHTHTCMHASTHTDSNLPVCQVQRKPNTVSMHQHTRKQKHIHDAVLFFLPSKCCGWRISTYFFC